MTLKTKLLAASLLVAASSVGAQEDAPLTIAADDISGSSTFLFDQASADRAGDYIQNYITGLDHPHRLVMVSMGDEGMGARQIDIRASVTAHRASNAQTLARQFADYFRAIPSLVQDSAITPQNTTSIIAFLQSLERACARGNTTAILFTDGVEWNAIVDGPGLMSGAVRLPMPDEPFLNGCRIELHGIGQLKSGLSSAGLAERLIPQWEAYLEAAGADSVLVTGSFLDF